MSLNLDIFELLKDFELDKTTKEKLCKLFEYTQYLFDNDDNLTKTLNLRKSARSKLIERLIEMFEEEFSEATTGQK